MSDTDISLDQDTWTTDFLAARPNQPGDLEAIQRREAANVLSSYSRASDFLAEALQNATDALDMRTADDADAARKILVTFDRSQGRFSVADTGIGMSRRDLELVLTPNVTLKAGRLARSTSGRSRGHKGVGLSFLALGANYLQIQTSDGEYRYDVVVRNGNRWVESGDDESVAKPMAQGTRNKADTFLGSRRYTVVTVGDINSGDFDEELFDYEVGPLEWLLRTKTAIGNTAPLFNEPFNADLPPKQDVDVRLIYIDNRGRSLPERRLPFRYATPEEYVPASKVMDFSELAGLDQASDVERALQGAGIRYRKAFTSASGREINLYVFIMAAGEVERYAEQARAKGSYAPEEWQGFWVATRDMPTNISFPPLVVQPRTWERRMFAVLQDDGLNLDLGRKTLVGRTVGMYREILQRAWRDISRYVGQVQPSSPTDKGTAALLRARVEEALRLGSLDVDVPYLKEPSRWVGVLALFHELLGRGELLPRLRTLQTGVFTKDRDALMYIGDPNGKLPLHVVYGLTLNEVFKTLEDLDGDPETAGLAVVWDIEELVAQRRGVEVDEVEGDETGATHMLRMHRLFDLDNLPVVALRVLLEKNR